jgi:hypothetical protein
MASLKSDFNRNLPFDFLETGKQLYTYFFGLGRVKRLSTEAHGFGLCATPDSRMTQLRSSRIAVLVHGAASIRSTQTLNRSSGIFQNIEKSCCGKLQRRRREWRFSAGFHASTDVPLPLQV